MDRKALTELLAEWRADYEAAAREAELRRRIEHAVTPEGKQRLLGQTLEHPPVERGGLER